MNRERAKELLPIITAFAEGKTIQKFLYEREWVDMSELMTWYDDSKYRIKPQTIKYRRYWLLFDNKTKTVGVANCNTTEPSWVERLACFAGWIDTEWQEIEVPE